MITEGGDQVGTIRIVSVVFALDGTTVESFDDIALLENKTIGAPSLIEDLSLPAGTYYIGVSVSGPGEYEFSIAQGSPMSENGDAEPNDAADAAIPLCGPFQHRGRFARLDRLVCLDDRRGGRATPLDHQPQRHCHSTANAQDSG